MTSVNLPASAKLGSMAKNGSMLADAIVCPGVLPTKPSPVVPALTLRKTVNGTFDKIFTGTAQQVNRLLNGGLSPPTPIPSFDKTILDMLLSVQVMIIEAKAWELSSEETRPVADTSIGIVTPGSPANATEYVRLTWAFAFTTAPNICEKAVALMLALRLGVARS